MSVGGYLAYLAAAQWRKAAGVIATTLADPRLPIVRDQFAKHPRLNRVLNPLLPALTAMLGGLRLPVRWFSNMEGIANDPELLRLLCDDPVGGGNRVPLRFLRSLLAIRPAIEPEEFDRSPPAGFRLPYTTWFGHAYGAWSCRIPRFSPLFGLIPRGFGSWCWLFIACFWRALT